MAEGINSAITYLGQGIWHFDGCFEGTIMQTVTRHGGSCAVSAPARIVARANKRRPPPFGMDADGAPPTPPVVEDPDLVADNE